MKNILIGMAGHIDHGKTTIIKYLTGKDTDTLPEEKKRGITIDIGFSYFKTSENKKIGIIDVPGHEKFIKNMVAGISGVNYIILVIACDDGIMPQTVEHFNIAKLLNIKNGMIVLSKTDLVDDEKKEKLKKEIKKFVKSSFLENSLITEVSNKDILSYERLKKVLEKDLEKISFSENLEIKENFRMSIDRCFSVTGFGTVVTGTISNGNISKGEIVTIYPLNEKVKIKKIEIFGDEVENINFGNRCALNISNIEKRKIKRGDIVYISNYKDTEKIDAEIEILNKNEIKNNQRVRLYLGTREIFGRIRILGTENIIGAGKHLIQITFEERVLCFYNELGIVRTYSPSNTIGGIRVLKTDAEKVKRDDKVYFEKIYNISKYGLQKENKKVNFIEILERYHSENPLKRGITKSNLKNIYFKNLNSKDFEEIINNDDNLKIEKISDKTYVSLKDFKVKLNKEQKKLKDKIFEIYKKNGFDICSYEDIKLNFLEKDFDLLHDYMVDEGMITFLEDNYYILKGFLKEAEKKILKVIEEKNKIYISEVREILNIDRKKALIILNKLDKMKIIKQEKDYRILY